MPSRKTKTKIRIRISATTAVLLVSILIVAFGIGYGFGLFRVQTRVFSVPTVTSCLPPPGGLVSWWDADSTQNTLAIDVKDGADGTIAGDVVLDAGKVGNAFRFFGETGVVTAPNRAEFTDTELTVEAWVKIEATNDNRVIAAKGAFTEEPSWFLATTENGGLRFRVYENSSNYSDASANAVIPKNVWTHVAATYNTKTLQQKLYVHGDPVQATIVKTGGDVTSLFDGSEPLTIGRDRAALVNQVPALIDEVSAYNRALTADEIKSIAMAGTYGKCKTGESCVTPPTGMAGWWDADAADAGTAFDLTAHANAAMQGGVGLIPGKVGRAFQFDGADDAVTAPPGMGFSSDKITVSAWVMPDALGNGVAVIASKDTPFGGQSSWSVFAADQGRLRFEVYAGPTVVRVIQTVKPVLFTGVWTHVAAVFDAETQDIAFYVNGWRETDVTISGDPVAEVYDGLSSLRIGARGTANDESELSGLWSGWIDEVMVFDRALSGAEVGALFESGVRGMCKPRV